MIAMPMPIGSFSLNFVTLIFESRVILFVPGVTYLFACSPFISQPQAFTPSLRRAYDAFAFNGGIVIESMRVTPLASYKAIQLDLLGSNEKLKWLLPRFGIASAQKRTNWRGGSNDFTSPLGIMYIIFVRCVTDKSGFKTALLVVRKQVLI